MHSDGNSRATLTIVAPRAEYSPGTAIQISLQLSSSNDWTDSSTFRLVGRTDAIVMGIDRYQVAVQTNIGSGGSAMMVTSRENLTFLDSGLELISPDDAHLDAGDDKKKAGGGRGDSVPTGLRGGIYSVTLPDWVTLPAFPPLADDPAGVSCRYTIELVGHRKGLFKKNDRISLELPVAIPLKTPITADELEECNWLTHSVHRPLKYQGADDQDVFVTATLSHRPITDPADPIIYSLDLLPSPAAQSLFSDPKISTFLARRIRTTPLEHTKSCKEFDWAGIRLNKGEVGIGDKVHGGGMRYRCSVKPPANQCSVEAEGFGVRYVLGCSVSSPSLVNDLIIKLPVYVPSTAAIAPPSNYEAVDNSNPQQLPEYYA